MKRGKTMRILHLYRLERPDFELCFNIGVKGNLSQEAWNNLKWLLAPTYAPQNLGEKTFLGSGPGQVVEIGPLMNYETPWSSILVTLCRRFGVEGVVRVERSYRYRIPREVDAKAFVDAHHDRMTQGVYPDQITSFDINVPPKPVIVLPLIEEGIGCLYQYCEEMGLSTKKWDVEFWYNFSVNILKRNPTNVEIFVNFGNNSEHSRHLFFNAKMIIDGKTMPRTLMEIVKNPLEVNPANSEVAFSDNASAIHGFQVAALIPSRPGFPSPVIPQVIWLYPTNTAETHNHPSGIDPYEGAMTGNGGQERDGKAIGQGAVIFINSSAYCTGPVFLPGWDIPGEDKAVAAMAHLPHHMASPLDIMIGASNGAADYCNRSGVGCGSGFVRTFGMDLPNGEFRCWLKAVIYVSGLGAVRKEHTKKDKPEPGWKIVQIGGPAFRVGFGGGSASSHMTGEIAAGLDWDSVQRGNPEEGRKTFNVVRTCVQLGKKNPLRVVHDQGAGGVSNQANELTIPAGGRADIRKIKVGDPTMADIELLMAEYQERFGFLVRPEDLTLLQSICDRENVNMEVLGEITGDGVMVFFDSNDGSEPFNVPCEPFEFAKAHGVKTVQQTYTDEHQPKNLKPLDIPPDLTFDEALRLVFRLPSVASKGWLVRKKDRVVGGRTARQQCCGPLQLAVSDATVVALSHLSLEGIAHALGEQPIKMLVSPAAGARMAVAEALTNIIMARITGVSNVGFPEIENIKCLANVMWAAKLPGEAADMYDAYLALEQIMIALGIAADGGKDSLSLATVKDGVTVKAPGQLVLNAYCTIRDIRKVLTPDIKYPGESSLIHIPVSRGRFRLGGSALGQVLSQLGNESPDIDDIGYFKNILYLVLALHDSGLVHSGHDISDGGLGTTLVEMAMSGNCGLRVDIPETHSAIAQLLAEEAGLVFEFRTNDWRGINELLDRFGVAGTVIAETTNERRVQIYQGKNLVLNRTTPALIKWWEGTSDAFEAQQGNPETAAQLALTHDRHGPTYSIPFEPRMTAPEILIRGSKPDVAVLREEGANSEEEMFAICHLAGLQPWDVTMTDLDSGSIKLDRFHGLIPVGGFSFMDVPTAGKGQAAVTKFNSRIWEQFQRFFFERRDTLSFAPCNGCQYVSVLGIVPGFPDLPETKQPRFIRNRSEKFESQWVTVKIEDSPAIMLRGMAGTQFGVWVDHGEGRLFCPDQKVFDLMVKKNLMPIRYVDDDGNPTEQYPLNPNGSPGGYTAICTEDGRHLAMMPHPERSFWTWHAGWVPLSMKDNTITPWLHMFQNMRQYLDESV